MSFRKKNGVRYMVISIGGGTNIKKILEGYSDEKGVNYVEGETIFLGTFHLKGNYNNMVFELSSLVGTLVFDITDSTNFWTNLPTNYEVGLFPELAKFSDLLNDSNLEIIKPPTYSSFETNQNNEEEYYEVDDILDKLSRNDYDRSKLTDNELDILDSIK